MQEIFLFFSTILSIFLTSTITYCFRTSVLYSNFVQNIFYHSASSFPLISALPSLQLSFQHYFFHRLLTLLIIHPSTFVSDCIPYCHYSILSSSYTFLPAIPPTSKKKINFLFSSRKCNYLSRVRFYRKSFFSQKINGINQYLYILIRYNTVLFSK